MDIKEALKERLKDLDYYKKELNEFLEKNETDNFLRGHYGGQLMGMRHEQEFIKGLIRNQEEIGYAEGIFQELG